MCVCVSMCECVCACVSVCVCVCVCVCVYDEGMFCSYSALNVQSVIRLQLQCTLVKFRSTLYAYKTITIIIIIQNG